MAQDTEPARPDATAAKPSENKASTAMADMKSDRNNDEAAGEDSENSTSDGFVHLRESHKDLRALIGECEKVDEDGAEDLLARLTRTWARHAAAHEALFNCAAEAGLDEFAPLNEGEIDTDLASFLLRRAGRDLEGAMQLAGLRVAARMIGSIIEREEKPRSGILAKVKGAGVDPDYLGRRIDACKQAQLRGASADRPQLRHLVVNQEDIMPRNMPERDEEGRFVSDRDHSNRSGGSGYGGRHDDDDRRYSSRGSRYDDDDRRYSRSSRNDDDDRRYSSRGSRYDEDDSSQSRDRGQGGWFGDPEGHSEASRKGWARREDDDDRYSSRGRSSSSRYDDDDRRYSSHDRDDDDRGRYSRSSRYDDDDRSQSRDRGQGGWFGDYEGHSEAAELGWERRRREGDDRGPSRRSRY